MPDRADLARAALDAASADEQVEAYAEEGRRTEVSALRGEVEGMTFAESRGVGVRVIRDDRLGYAWAAGPTPEEVRDAVRRARENAALAEPDPANGLPEPEPFEPIPELFREESANVTADDKVRMALDLEAYAISRDPRVTKIDVAQVGDSVASVHIASTAGVDAGFSRTDAWGVVVTLATEGDETQTGFSYRITRGLDELDTHPLADEAVARGARMLGATKPATARVPVILDQFAAMSFLGVLSSTLNAENVLKGRSLFADRVGDAIGSEPFTLVDDGRILDGPGASPFDDEGVPSGRTELFRGGVLRGFLHDTYTARRAGGGQRSTGNARRGYRSAPGVGTSNFYVEAGGSSLADLLARAEGGVLIQDVSGVHSGANPISGEFSVGATGLRVAGGALGE
ncbi:MAG TPA: TldD/PmbA family protein, partial [Actinomycetota bacterium]